MESRSVTGLAEKIAKVIETESQRPEMAAIFATLERINHRLDKLESNGTETVSATKVHASLDKFNVIEAIANDVFSGVKEEKACQFEPDKPCDHCSMCNSRGF